MHRQGRLISTIVIAVLAAAFGWTPVFAQVHEEIRVRQGQRKPADEGKLTVSLISVLEDSRCPVNVTCIWAGNVRIRLEVVKGRSRRTVELNSAVDPKDVSVLGYRIKLLDVMPRPGEKVKMRPAARLEITKEPSSGLKDRHAFPSGRDR